MTPDIEALSFDELRTLHREIGALIAERRTEALEQLRSQISVLGFSIEDIAGKKQRRRRRKQTDEDDAPS